MIGEHDTVQSANGDYAELISDKGHVYSLTMFLLPEGTASGLALENFQWVLLE